MAGTMLQLGKVTKVVAEFKVTIYGLGHIHNVLILRYKEDTYLEFGIPIMKPIFKRNLSQSYELLNTSMTSNLPNIGFLNDNMPMV